VVAILMATLLKGMLFFFSSFIALIDSLALSTLYHQIMLARLLRDSKKNHRSCSNCHSLVVTLVVVVVMVAEAVEAATEGAALEAEVVTECPLLVPTSRSRTGI